MLDTQLPPRFRLASIARALMRSGVFLIALGVETLNTSSAYAATKATDSTGVAFIAALLALILVGRVLGEAMNRIGQPSVMGQLLAGILLGPSLLGWIYPDFQHTGRLDARRHFPSRNPVAASADRNGDRP
ncbi:MAG: cation:proton antiporter, partial [Methyloceanibacter sp.]